MANTLYSSRVDLWHQHHTNVVKSLNHRLEVARANQDTRLVALLEQEQKQITVTDRDQFESLQYHLSTLWDDFLTLIRGDVDLRVWQTVDQQGDRWWCAYNPQTGQSVYADSETEMRLWIEQNYSEAQ